MRSAYDRDSMDALQKNIADSLNHQQGAMRDLLRRLVLIQSGSRHKAGVDEVCREIYQWLEPLSLERRIVPQSVYGDLLIASVPGGEAKRRILMAGHMDTIFPVDTTFCGWREDERHFYGPGVIDMKGGLVVGLFALKALDHMGLLKTLPITWIFNSEEEIGSPVSRPFFIREAGRSVMAFVLEAAGEHGEVVTGRKGRLELRIATRGRAGHAAQIIAGKKSAILDLARLIVELEELSGRFPGLSVNIGQVAGGIVANSVPEDAWASVDVRFPGREGLAFFQERLEEILRRRRAEAMEVMTVVVEQVPVMEATSHNKALFGVVGGAAKRLGLSVGEQFRAGASDASAIAAVGTPVLDGLGPVGGDDHSDREFAVRDSFPARSALLALSLVEAWRSYEAGSLFPSR